MGKCEPLSPLCPAVIPQLFLYFLDVYMLFLFIIGVVGVIVLMPGN